MKQLNLMGAGACGIIGVLCLFTGSPILGGINLFLAVVNFHLAAMYE